MHLSPTLNTVVCERVHSQARIDCLKAENKKKSIKKQGQFRTPDPWAARRKRYLCATEAHIRPLLSGTCHSSLIPKIYISTLTSCFVSKYKLDFTGWVLHLAFKNCHINLEISFAHFRAYLDVFILFFKWSHPQPSSFVLTYVNGSIWAEYYGYTLEKHSLKTFLCFNHELIRLTWLWLWWGVENL